MVVDNVAVRTDTTESIWADMEKSTETIDGSSAPFLVLRQFSAQWWEWFYRQAMSNATLIVKLPPLCYTHCKTKKYEDACA